MLEANTQEEFIDAVKAIKRRALTKVLPTGDKIRIGFLTVGSDAESNVKYDWLHHNESIAYNNGLEELHVNVKAPTLIGMGIARIRQFEEQRFNDGFIIYESMDDALAREAATIASLYEKDGKRNIVPEPMQGLLTDIEGRPLVQGVVLTRAAANPRYTVDLMIDALLKKDADRVKGYIADGARTLKRLHEDHQTIWGDANLINTSYEGDAMRINNFPFSPDPTKYFSALIAKDFIEFALTTVYRSRLPRGMRKNMTEAEVGTYIAGLPAEDVVKTIVEEYNPRKDIRDELRKSIEDTIQGGMNGLVKRVGFYQPVYGMTREEGLELTMKELGRHAMMMPALFMIYNAVSKM